MKQDLKAISEIERIANLPIGSIVASMLPPALFLENVKDPPVFHPKDSKWMLADGDKDKDITRSRYQMQVLMNLRLRL